MSTPSPRLSGRNLRFAPSISAACCVRPNCCANAPGSRRARSMRPSSPPPKMTPLRDAIRLQERLGFKFVTDGEFRRRSYHSFFYGALGQLRIDTIGGADAVGADGARRARRTAGRDYRKPRAMDPSDQCGRRGLPENAIGSLAEDHDSRPLRAALPRRRCRGNGKCLQGRGSVLVGHRRRFHARASRACRGGLSLCPDRRDRLRQIRRSPRAERARSARR